MVAHLVISSNGVFHICTAYRLRRRNAYRSSSTSVTTSVTLSEKSELSESVDAYFGRTTPSQSDQVVVEEQEHRPVPRTRHPIREFMHHSHFSSLDLICASYTMHQLK